MNNIFIFLFSLITLLYAEDKMLWDLGIIIKAENNTPNTKNDIIKPLISNTQIAPLYKKHDDINPFDIANIKIDPKHLLKLLYLNNQYFELTDYVQKIKNINSKFYSFNDEQILIYADALYQIGNYNEAINNLYLLSESYPIDEKYFILALYNKKAGNINSMVKLLNNLITDYPNSDYIKLAKLQAQQLK